MLKDVYEPLSRYRDEFRTRFAELTRARFAELTKASGIDVAANRRQAALVRRLESGLDSARGTRRLYVFLLVLVLIAALSGLGVLFVSETLSGGAMAACVLVLLGSVPLGLGLRRKCKEAGTLVRSFEKRVAEGKSVAWNQMAALNGLYPWDVTLRLVEQTVPRLSFDAYFTSRRLEDLRRIYGWDDAFNEGRSILGVQSGVINGNPFVFGEYLEMEWGTETYTGSLVIEWEEEVEDDEGNVHTETRTQTLTASVEKPKPVYSRQKFVAYGNDAAPDLSFSRLPSGLEEKGVVSALKKQWRLSRLKAHSRNLTDDSDFTLMSNHEFETWFHAKDRDNEVEFRLLYTALAQTQTLALLKDREVGFGDDFAFVKQKKVNFLFPQHLADAVIDVEADAFRDWDYDRAASKFQKVNEKFFKDVYFALAPLLAIPLYQQTRTHEDLWRGVVGSEACSFWEHEVSANRFGDEAFRHPDCITENILKTALVERTDGVSTVEVTACGYRGEDRLDYVSVFGGDGEWHEVPVEWVEYLPVERTSPMTVAEGRSAGPGSPKRGRWAGAALFRREIWSSLVRA